MAGLTPTGLEIKRFPDIQQSLDTRLKESFGEATNTSDDSLYYYVRDILGQEIADLWEFGQAVYDSGVPSACEGAAQDDNYDLVNVKRLKALPSTIPSQLFIGNLGAKVPKDFLLELSSGVGQFYVESEVIVSNAYAQQVQIEVNVVQNSTLYSISAGDVDYTYTSDGSATIAEILVGLKANIDADGDRIISATISGEVLTIIHNDTDLDTPAAGTQAYSLSNNLKFVKIGILTLVKATETGPLEAPLSQLTTIKVAADGIDSTVNLEIATLGRNRETDSEYRLRREITLSNPGVAVIDAIADKVSQNVTGVNSAVGIENRRHFPDSDGRPPHSFEIIVDGGANNAIAQQIWDAHPAGIESFGSESGTAVDRAGKNQKVYFSRVDPVYVWVDVEYVKYDEESFPLDGEDAMIAAILARGDEHISGEDVIPQRFIPGIFANVSGLESLTITLATSVTEVGPPGAYSSTKVAVDLQERASFGIARISVAEV